MNQKDDEALKAMEQAAKEPWEDVEDKQEKLKLLFRKIGQAQVFGFMTVFHRMSAVKILKEIHDSKLYKLYDSQFEKFCQDHFGISRQVVFDDFKIFNHLGMEFVSRSDNIGLPYKDIRQLARLKAKNLLATANKSITIDEEIFELTDDNKESIQQAIAELQMKLAAEKRKADTFKKMMDNREAKATQLEQELKQTKNPNPHKTEIEELIDKADANIMLGLTQLNSIVRRVITKEKETGEHAPERPLCVGLLGKTKFALMEAIEIAEKELGEVSELEIRKDFEKMGMPLPEGEPE